MKHTKRELMPLYSYYDRSGIAAHLADMAAQGWMLDKLSGWCWRYRRAEPRKLRFAVTYFPAASQFDPGPSEGLETYRDYCAAAGWQLAADNAQVQIFFNEDENAIPIETDPMVEFTNIRRCMRKSFLTSYCFLLLLSLLQIGFQLWQVWTNPVDTLSNGFSLIAVWNWLPLDAVIVAELARYFRWQRRAKTAAEAGSPLPELRSIRWLSFLLLGWSGVIPLWMLLSAFRQSRGMLLLMAGTLLYMSLMHLLSFAAKDALRHLRAPRWANIAVTFGVIIALTVGGMAGLLALIFHNSGSGWLEDHPPVETYEYQGWTWAAYQDDIPLRIEDLVAVDYDHWSTEAQVDSSPLLTYGEYSQRPRMDAPDQPDLEYEIVTVKAGFLYDLCKNDFISWVERNNDQLPQEYWDEYRPVGTAPWNADKVYQRYYSGESVNQFLICWPDRIAEVKFDWDWTITEEMMAVTAEKLKNA